MSTLKSILSVVAGLVFLAGFFPYILAIVRKETKPSKASWVIWAVLDTITILGMYAEDAVNGQIIGAVLGVWIVVVLTLKYGELGWTKLDAFCLFGAILGIVLWQAFSNPVLGILTSQCVAFIGSIPTFVSTWRDPSKENRTAWTIFWLSCVTAILAIPAWTVQDVAQPITFFTIETVMMYLLYVRPRINRVCPSTPTNSP